MAAEDVSTERTAVKTYVPSYERDIWDEHADELDMSRSEFVRSMVQAGRRGFDPGGSTTNPPENGAEPTEPIDADNREPPVTDGSFDELVVELLGDEDCLSWEALFEELTADVEQRLDDTLQRLQDENRVQHSGRRGGYVLVE